MKPEGLKHFKFPGKTDAHPKKGWRNWWEKICSPGSRSMRKQNLKKSIFDDPKSPFYGWSVKEVEDPEHIMGFWDFWD